MTFWKHNAICQYLIREKKSKKIKDKKKMEKSQQKKAKKKGKQLTNVIKKKSYIKKNKI